MEDLKVDDIVKIVEIGKIDEYHRYPELVLNKIYVIQEFDIDNGWIAGTFQGINDSSNTCFAQVKVIKVNKQRTITL
jgi:hypothetical protein